jgi:Holliday junction resolvase
LTTSTPGAPGTKIDSVVVEIDYDIIEHFSEHLYSSPNKAIEELVSNGYDAFASSTYVYIPGSFTTQSVLVWDDGTSMGAEDLKKLWWIAQSPKERVPGRIAVSEDGKRQRAMIGKFGIGKLASYAVGDQIAHLCRREDEFLLVAVNYREVPHIEENKPSQPYETPILQLTEVQAREFVASLFNSDVEPKALEHLWGRDRWTLAIIDHLKEGVRLTEGRLSWVLGNGMPLRPDFRVWVNDQEVTARIARDAIAEWDLAQPKILNVLEAEWKAACASGDVEGDYRVVPAERSSSGRAVVEFPRLGLVDAEVRLLAKAQKGEVSREALRSHGFFVLVRDRLINPNDELLLLPPPSYGTFNRSQFVIRADGLDPELLADRERIRRDTPRTRELALLQRVLYLAARDEIEMREAQAAWEARSESLLPLQSRPYFRVPMTALLLRQDLPLTEQVDPTATRVDRTSLGEDAPLAAVTQGGLLQVNIAHPLFGSVRKRLGTGAAASKALQVFDLFAVSERLLEGYLYDLGLEDDQIDQILEWRDGLFREIAARFEVAPLEEVVREAYETSYKGGKAFEQALVKLFRLMGFEAEHQGASGKWDGLVVAPIGMAHYRFTIEAKGNKDAVVNDEAEIAGVAAHRDAVGAQHGIIVAREFAGFRRGEDPAVLKECRSTKGVSIVTIKALEELHDAVRSFGYPLESVLPVLAEIESPDAKLERIRTLQRPTEDFDYPGVLNAIWQDQQGYAEGNLVSYRTVWLMGPDRWNVEFDDFERRLLALETLAGGTLMRVVTSPEKVVTLLQHPDILSEQVRRRVEVRELPA